MNLNTNRCVQFVTSPSLSLFPNAVRYEHLERKCQNEIDSVNFASAPYEVHILRLQTGSLFDITKMV